jgi:hypothetical protein
MMQDGDEDAERGPQIWKNEGGIRPGWKPDAALKARIFTPLATFAYLLISSTRRGDNPLAERESTFPHVVDSALGHYHKRGSTNSRPYTSGNRTLISPTPPTHDEWLV